MTTSAEVREAAEAKLKQMFPHGRPRFGDARDQFVADRNAGKEDIKNPCTSKGLSTMPRRAR